MTIRTHPAASHGPLDLRAAEGAALAPHRVSWSAADPIAVALAAGCTPADDLPYVYEGMGPRVLPTFASVVAGQWLVPLLDRLGRHRSAALYRGVEAALHRPIAGEGEALVTGSIERVDLRGRNARIRVATEAADADGPLLTAAADLVLPGRGDGGDAAPVPRTEAPAAPDATATVHVHPAAAAIYRLIFPLEAGTPFADAAHVDPELAHLAGLDRPVVHGVTLAGIAVRWVMALERDHAVTGYRARFARPVPAEAEIRLQGWRADDGWEVAGMAGTEVAFRIRVGFGRGPGAAA